MYANMRQPIQTLLLELKLYSIILPKGGRSNVLYIVIIHVLLKCSTIV